MSINKIEKIIENYFLDLSINNIKIDDLKKIENIYGANIYCVIKKGEKLKNIGKVGHVFYDPKTDKIFHSPSTTSEIKKNIENLLNL